MKRLFALAFLLFAQALAAPANEPCSDAFSALKNSAGEERAISLNAMNLDATLKNLVQEVNRPEVENLPRLLRMALENAMQHGVEDMYMPFPAAVKLRVAQTEKGTEIFLTNDLFKKFPERLECHFHPGESVELTRAERPGPCGVGIGLKQMFGAFSSFPKDSDMAWTTQEGKVTLRLSIPRP